MKRQGLGLGRWESKDGTDSGQGAIPVKYASMELKQQQLDETRELRITHGVETALSCLVWVGSCWEGSLGHQDKRCRLEWRAGNDVHLRRSVTQISIGVLGAVIHTRTQERGGGYQVNFGVTCKCEKADIGNQPIFQVKSHVPIRLKKTKKEKKS